MDKVIIVEIRSRKNGPYDKLECTIMYVATSFPRAVKWIKQTVKEGNVCDAYIWYFTAYNMPVDSETLPYEDTDLRYYNKDGREMEYAL